MSCSNLGARKHRNIREHLFVINVIINDVCNSKDNQEIDIQLYDVAKCFDKLEYTNTAIDFFNAGVQDDKFVLVSNSNKSCDVAIKTPFGLTERTTFSNIEMQGTVLAGLKCSISIDSIGKETLQNKHQRLYRYKNSVSIPPLSFIDDIINVAYCSPDSVKACATTKAKIAGKQLELGSKKCFQIHVGKPNSQCSTTLKINDTKMQKASSERYLGDIISADNKRDIHINDRYNKGISYVNQILSILKEISFGFYYFEQAMQLRNAKLINGILCSVEALYGLTSAHIEKLERCDSYFFRKIFNAPITTPTESFYLETSALPIRFVIIGRRLLFYWNILNKPESELIKQVYRIQKLRPVRNDWCSTIAEDLKNAEIDLTETEIASMKKSTFKSLVNQKIKECAARYLLGLRQKHSKSKELRYSNSMQKYLVSNSLSTQEKQLLFSFRSHTYQCKANYSYIYGTNLQCNHCTEIDNQQHLLNCKLVEGINLNGSKYSDIFGSIDAQTKIIKVLKQVTDKRKNTSSISGSQAHLS